jgi:3-oxoacyl-[acyl-carrier-protein] synthase-3
MKAYIRAIEYHLPHKVLTTAQLAEEHPEWAVEKIDEKTGIRSRHIASAGECASDLAVQASEKLFQSGICQPRDIDYVLLCTQSPDYCLPTTACLLQRRLGLGEDVGAVDFNLGCSGYVYGLGLAQGLIETGQAQNVLLLTAETYSKFISAEDRSVRTLFGDAAAATLVSGCAEGGSRLGPYVYGTDGRGAPNLIVPAGGARLPWSPDTAVLSTDGSGNTRSPNNLFMDGAAVFSFTLTAVPCAVTTLLSRSTVALEDVDLFVFHQANQYLLNHLRAKLRLPEDKFYVALRDCGNTVSSTIPIAIKHAQQEGRLKKGMLLMLVGFGVGYSWGATLARWCN